VSGQLLQSKHLQDNTLQMGWLVLDFLMEINRDQGRGLSSSISIHLAPVLPAYSSKFFMVYPVSLPEVFQKPSRETYIISSLSNVACIL
jgi:hypothetical protein